MRRASSRGRPRISMLPYRGIETSRLVTGTKGRCKFVVADGVIRNLMLTMESRAQMIEYARVWTVAHTQSGPKEHQINAPFGSHRRAQ